MELEIGGVRRVQNQTEYKLNASCFLKDIVEPLKKNIPCSSYSPIKAGCASPLHRVQGYLRAQMCNPK